MELRVDEAATWVQEGLAEREGCQISVFSEGVLEVCDGCLVSCFGLAVVLKWIGWARLLTVDDTIEVDLLVSDFREETSLLARWWQSQLQVASCSV